MLYIKKREKTVDKEDWGKVRDKCVDCVKIPTRDVRSEHATI